MVTAKLVQELREKTGCGMMDCKKALTETDGDLTKAMKYLREKGMASAAKKAGRIAAEGIVDSIVEGTVGVVVEVNAETDFVAKNAEFRSFVTAVAQQIAKNNPADVQQLLAQSFIPTPSMTVEGALKDKIATIGENMNIRRFARYDGAVETYIHGGGRIGVMVEFGLDNGSAASNPTFAEVKKDIAMQVAAAVPKYIVKAEVPEEVVQKEREILKAQAINEGKPEAIAEKMVVGRVEKFYKEVCIMEQAYIKDPSKSVTDFLREKSAEIGANISIKQFVRFEKGEGIEKRQDDFAAEVEKMIK